MESKGTFSLDMVQIKYPCQIKIDEVCSMPTIHVHLKEAYVHCIHRRDQFHSKHLLESFDKDYMRRFVGIFLISPQKYV